MESPSSYATTFSRPWRTVHFIRPPVSLLLYAPLGSLLSGLSLFLKQSLLERAPTTLAIDVDSKLSHVESARLQRGLKSVLSVEQELPNLHPIRQEVSVNGLVHHGNTDVDMPQLWLGHFQHH